MGTCDTRAGSEIVGEFLKSGVGSAADRVVEVRSLTELAASMPMSNKALIAGGHLS